MDEGGGDRSTGDRDEEEDTGKRASQHADHYEQSCIHYERSRQKIRGHQIRGGVRTTVQPGPGY